MPNFMLYQPRCWKLRIWASKLNKLKIFISLYFVHEYACCLVSSEKYKGAKEKNVIICVTIKVSESEYGIV